MVWKFIFFLFVSVFGVPVMVMANELSLSKLLEFSAVQTEKNVVGTVKGYETKRYQIRAKKLQILRIDMKSKNIYFNLYAPYKRQNEDDALFVGKSQGSRCKVHLSKTGLYMIEVYLGKDEAKADIKRIFEMHIKLQ